MDVLTGLGQTGSLSQHRLGLRLELGDTLSVRLLQTRVTLDRKLEVRGVGRRGRVWAEERRLHAEGVGGDHAGHGVGAGAQPGVAGHVHKRELPGDNLHEPQRVMLLVMV